MSLVVAIVTDLQQKQECALQNSSTQTLMLFHGKAVPLGNCKVILLLSRNKVLVNF